jgi:hypothetical protein
MDTTAHEMIKLLLEIVMDLYEANMEQREYHDIEPISEIDHILKNEQSPGNSVHAKATNTVFFAIRQIQLDFPMEPSSSMKALRHYDMKNLCELLPLAAIYHVKPLTACKVGFFLANLSHLRENVSFDVRRWMQTTLFAANIQFPMILRRDDDPHPPPSFPAPASSGGPARVPPPSFAAIPPPSYPPPRFAGRAPSPYPRVHATMPHGFHTDPYIMSDH